jgi:very-short-patch-repair endonuclease
MSPGVYAVGHTRLTAKGRWMAAVLACGSGAVLSHHQAAALWDLRPMPSGKIHVTALGKRKVEGVRCHVVRDLPAQDCTFIDAVPVTSLNRTLLDVAPEVSDQRLRSYLEAAQRQGLLDVRALDALITRSPGRAGRSKLKAAAAALTDHAPWIQSGGERKLLELLRAGGLPEPSCNVYVEGELVDLVWLPQRLVVEIDHYFTHGSKRSFEDDRRRDAKLQRAGFRILRITYDRLERDPQGVIADIAAIIAQAA